MHFSFIRTTLPTMMKNTLCTYSLTHTHTRIVESLFSCIGFLAVHVCVCVCACACVCRQIGSSSRRDSVIHDGCWQLLSASPALLIQHHKFCSLQNVMLDSQNTHTHTHRLHTLIYEHFVLIILDVQAIRKKNTHIFHQSPIREDTLPPRPPIIFAFCEKKQTNTHAFIHTHMLQMCVCVCKLTGRGFPVGSVSTGSRWIAGMS